MVSAAIQAVSNAAANGALRPTPYQLAFVPIVSRCVRRPINQ